jgi:hypothetical protein
MNIFNKLILLSVFLLLIPFVNAQNTTTTGGYYTSTTSTSTTIPQYYVNIYMKRCSYNFVTRMWEIEMDFSWTGYYAYAFIDGVSSSKYTSSPSRYTMTEINTPGDKHIEVKVYDYNGLYVARDSESVYCYTVDTTTTTIPPQQCEVSDYDLSLGETRTSPASGFSEYGNQPTIPGQTLCEGGLCSETCEDNRYLSYECYCEQGSRECQHEYDIDCKAECGNDAECLTVEKDSEFATDPNTHLPIKIKLGYCGIKGDVNIDGKVDIVDISIMATAFMSEPGDKRWKSAADLDNNGIVNIVDITLAALKFNKVCSPTTTIPSFSSQTGRIVLISETFNVLVVLTTLILLVFLFGLFKIRTKK